DIGVSSMQLDRADRGFSFSADGPLDMRMSRSGLTAAEFLNSADEAEIARILRDYGEEPRARAIARAIVAARPVERTAELAATVLSNEIRANLRSSGWRSRFPRRNASWRRTPGRVRRGCAAQSGPRPLRGWDECNEWSKLQIGVHGGELRGSGARLLHGVAPR